MQKHVYIQRWSWNYAMCNPGGHAPNPGPQDGRWWTNPLSYGGPLLHCTTKIGHLNLISIC